MYLQYDELLACAFPDGRSPEIRGVRERDQIRFESIDCRLEDRVYRMLSSALPRKTETIRQLIESYCMYSFRLSDNDKVLESGKPYIIPLRESLAPSLVYSAYFSPKSSTGRCFTFVRVLSDRNSFYDRIPQGYKGKLYLEVTPLPFTISLRAGVDLVQMRIRDQFDDRLTSEYIHLAHKTALRCKVAGGVVFSKEKKPMHSNELNVHNNRLYFTLDLDRRIAGFVAKESCIQKLDWSRTDHNPLDFWDPIVRPADGQLILKPGRFYLLCTKERVKIPPDLCGSVVDYETGSGEFRTHFASFFAPGFGGETGTPIVLEVRGLDAPFRLVDNQTICCMEFHRIRGIPSLLNGGRESYYDGAVSLSKHFKDRKEIWEE